ncbi:hypothetical protein EDC04DRAFT_2887652 [Pisolithus marmoratus]|nr:hypothetical protein EDC04DRAFT_2887652 [Pisolithus marmoratus]
MSTTEEQLQLPFTALYQIRVLNYVTLSSAAFLVYDVLTNLDKEVHFIWDITITQIHHPFLGPIDCVESWFKPSSYSVAIMHFSTSLCISLVCYLLCRFTLLSYGIPVYNNYGLSVSLYAII